MLDELLAYCRSEGRVCPVPHLWNRMWQGLPGRRIDADRRWTPAPPLILAAWHDTPDAQKVLRLKVQLRWAADNGALEQVDRFLRALRPEDWHRKGDLS